ncbi:hypothetical protein [Heliorestis convoluta]|uniref:Uncharacterized protein n=1 Tax=Heliorestis convoluta TaxID=356322 RepID=A0A5Q2NA25_9FIRM|nr:hypothetical protein [Heliorestis convoluta]QGG49130.1 hypothetical protein FTV88_3055 [Heliorestis convoluta]
MNHQHQKGENGYHNQAEQSDKKKDQPLQNHELTNLPSAVDPDSLQGIPSDPGMATIEEHDTLPEISKDPR